MAEPNDKPNLTGDPGSPGSADTPAIDPREFESLRTKAEQFDRLSQTLSPYAEDIDRFISDENYRNVAKTAYEAYTNASKANEPEIPEYVKKQDERLDKLVGYVDDLKTQTAIQNAARQVETLAQQYPALAENNYALLNDLQNEAKQFGIQSMDQFVTYLRTSAPRLFKAVEHDEQPERVKAPPRSSRPDGGLPGVPEPKQPVFDGKTARERIAQRKKFISSSLQKAMGR